MAIAIGLLDLAAAGRDDKIHRERIRSRAAAEGHTLVEIVEMTPDMFMPIVYVGQLIDKTGATVLIAPHIDHVWDKRRGWTVQASVIVCDPDQVWQRNTIWALPAAARTAVVPY